MTWKTEEAYAKINLYLDIEGKREDGYHDVVTLMQIVSLSDKVSVSLNHSKEITLKMINSPIDIPIEENLAYRAAQKFYDNLDFEAIGRADITIEKHIPCASGLSGGSADAAAVLRILNELYGKLFMIDDLCKLGAELGADVPFNIKGGVQMCQGIGEKMLETRGLRHYSLMIALGNDTKLSTAEQYKKLDEIYDNFKDYQVSENCGDTFAAYSVGRCSEAFGKMYNIFETLYQDNEDFQKIKKIMYEHSAYVAMLTGSGPAIYGIFPNSLYAEDAQAELEREGIKTYICYPINITYEIMDPNIKPWKVN